MLTCYSNERVPLELTPCSGRTQFQIDYAMWLAKRANFAFFGMNPMCHNKRRGSCTYTFVTKDGRMHIHRLGLERVIRMIVAS